MSFALSWDADETQPGGFVYFDAVTAFTRNYRGQITKHPIDSGGSVTDHFIRENPTFSLSAVFSNADISVAPNFLTNETGGEPYNKQGAVNAVSVNSTDASVLTKFLPDSIGQFLPDSTPEVIMDEAVSRNYLNDWTILAETLSNLISGDKPSLSTGLLDNSIQEVKLYETNGTTLLAFLPRNQRSSLVITSITFKEDASSGFGLYCDITFEQVSFVSLLKTQLPKDVQSSLSSAAAGKSSKGKQDSTPESDADDLPEESDEDGFKTPFGKQIDRKRFQLGQPLGV